MQNAVNNLIYNTLIADGSVALPSVGRLSIIRRPASMSGKKVSPPQYVVEFSSATEGRTIVDVVSDVASVDLAQAEDIYRRWLDKVRTERGVVIEGVGELRNKSFVVVPELLSALNSVGNAPIRITRRRSGGVWLYAVAAMLIIAVAAYFAIGYFDTPYIVACEETNIEVEKGVSETEYMADAETIADVVEEPVMGVAEEPVAEVVEEPVTEVAKAWNEEDDIRHWVVIGTYSTSDNAERAKRDAERGDEGCVCDVFRLGSMYAVVAFGAVEREACEEFKRAHRAEYPQAWIHTPKRKK